MRDSIMLYRYPGKIPIHGDLYDYIIVEESRKDFYLKDGWHLTTTEAKAASMMKAQIKTNDFTGKIPPSMLTKETISMIFNDNDTQRELADRYNVSTFTVHKIKSGKLK